MFWWKQHNTHGEQTISFCFEFRLWDYVIFISFFKAWSIESKAEKSSTPRLEHPPPRVFTISYTLYSLTITSYWSGLAPRAEWSLDNKIHFVSCTILKILPIDEKINYCQKWAEFWGNQCFTMIQSLQGSLSSPGNRDYSAFTTSSRTDHWHWTFWAGNKSPSTIGPLSI